MKPGGRHQPETRAKISAALKGRAKAPEHTEAVAAAQRCVWRTETPSQSAVHDRLRRVRGRAADHPCIDCGGQARDWAFEEPSGYSTDLSRYHPRCRSCHAKQDGRRRPRKDERR